MTREETKVKTFDILHFVADNAGLSTFEAIEKAYNMGVSEQETEWIPINERLPESDGYYLVTEKSGRVCTYVFHKEGNSGEYWKRCAVAWMPLPEPYNSEIMTESERSEDMTLAEKILDFIEENYPTKVINDWEKGCAYALDEIEKICEEESEE